MSDLELLFPTASKRIQIYHRAGLLEYPAPRKPSAFDPSTATWIRTHPNRSRSRNPQKEDADSDNSQDKHEEEDAYEEESEVRQAETDNLEKRVEELTGVVKKLIAAIVDSQKTLDGGLDDPRIAEILDSLRNEERRQGDE